eukprot:UN24108
MSSVELEKGLEMLINETFDMFDRDGNAKIDLNEFRAAWCWLGVDATDEEVEYTFNEIDDDQSGEIDIQEFTKAIKQSSYVTKDINVFNDDVPSEIIHATTEKKITIEEAEGARENKREATMTEKTQVGLCNNSAQIKEKNARKLWNLHMCIQMRDETSYRIQRWTQIHDNKAIEDYEEIWKPKKYIAKWTVGSRV